MSGIENRKQMRVEVSGKMVATHLPEERHGTRSGYNYWFCRCEACAHANRTRKRNRDGAEASLRNQWLTVAASSDQLSEQDRYLVGEYKHMRSFGKSHEAACARIGWSRTAVENALRRALAVAS